MNNERRKRIQVCINALDDIQSKINNILSDEEDAFDNLPEGLQSSARGESMESAIETLNEAVDLVDDAARCLEELI